MGISSLYYYSVWAIDICVEGNFFWFFAGGMNGIFKGDIENGRLELLTEIDGCEKTDAVKFSCGIKVGSKLFFCPFNSNCICEYDMKKNSTKIFKSEQLICPRINNVVHFKDNLYLFGKNQSFIATFDLTKEEINIMQNERFCKKYVKGNPPIRDLIIREEFVYIADKDNIIELNLLTNNVQEYFIEKNIGNDRADTLAFDGKDFWILYKKNGLVQWNKEEGELFSSVLPILGQAVKSVVSGEFLYILYNDVNKILIFNRYEKKFYVVDAEYCVAKEEKGCFSPFVLEKRTGLYIYTS